MNEPPRGVSFGRRPTVAHRVFRWSVESDPYHPGWFGRAYCGPTVYSLERHASMWQKAPPLDDLPLCGHCAKFVAESPGQTDHPTGRIAP